MDELQHVIKQKQELLARESISRPAVDYSEGMTAEEQKRYINYLAERVNAADLENRAMKLVLQDFLDEKKSYDERLAKLDSLVSDVEDLKTALASETKKRKSAERKVADLSAKLKFADKNRFGDKSQKVKKIETTKAEESDRGKDEDDFDGTSSSLPGNSVSKSEASSNEENPSKKERDLSNRPETYKTMCVKGPAEEYKSDESKVPGRILDKKMVSVFHLEMSLVEKRFEMVHYVEKGKKPKWGYFPKTGNPEFVTKFDGTKATPEFLQAIAYEVYVKNVTFGLLHQWLTDMGMTVSPNTLRNWLKKGKVYLDQLVESLKEVALEKDSIVNCDETWCKVRKCDHYKKCYIWVLVNKAERVVIFFYDNGSRGRDVLTDFIGDAELKSIMSDGYNAYTFIGNELKIAETPNFSKTDHQVCLAHARAKFVKASEQAGDKNADIFIKYIEDLYSLERQYTKDGLTDEERGRQRQGLETKGILINLCTHLGIEKAKDPAIVTPYLQKALNYLDTFWTNIFAYTKDGSYPIDNNAAERAVRPLTTQRNSMLHFGSDEGAKMAATYHSIISTVKLQGRSAWDYLGKFFVNIFNGCRDFFSLRPDNIGLATCQ